jgi:hypothetical protein
MTTTAFRTEARDPPDARPLAETIRRMFPGTSAETATAASAAALAVIASLRVPGADPGADDTRARLAPVLRPMPLQEWAGQVVGSTELSRRLGVPSSTLQDWYDGGHVIGLVRGTRKRAYPLAQFVDGRPIPGIAEVARSIGAADAAWWWLVSPHGAFEGARPLDLLAAGRIADVVAVAADDYA